MSNYLEQKKKEFPWQTVGIFDWLVIWTFTSISVWLIIGQLNNTGNPESHNYNEFDGCTLSEKISGEIRSVQKVAWRKKTKTTHDMVLNVTKSGQKIINMARLLKQLSSYIQVTHGTFSVPQNFEVNLFILFS